MSAEENPERVDGERTGESQSCDPGVPAGERCSTSGGGGGKNVKIAVFVLVALLVGVVAAHSVLTKNRCGAAGRCCPDSSVSAGCPSDEPGGGSLGCPGAAKTSAGKTCGAVKKCPSEGSQEPLGSCCPGGGEHRQRGGRGD